MFICGGIPLAVLADLGFPISDEAWLINERTGRELHARAGGAAEKVRALLKGGSKVSKGLWDYPETTSCDHLAEFPRDRTNVFGLDYTRFPDTLKIDIPTVHIYGTKDPRYPSAMHLIYCSDEGKRRVYDHAGGHEIPRTTVVSETIADLVKWLEGTVGG